MLKRLSKYQLSEAKHQQHFTPVADEAETNHG